MKRLIILVISCITQLFAEAQRSRPEVDFDDDFHYSTDTPFSSMVDLVVGTIILTFIFFCIYWPGVKAKIKDKINKERNRLKVKSENNSFLKAACDAKYGKWVYAARKDFKVKVNDTTIVVKEDQICFITGPADIPQHLVNIKLLDKNGYMNIVVPFADLKLIDKDMKNFYKNIYEHNRLAYSNYDMLSLIRRKT